MIERKRRKLLEHAYLLLENSRYCLYFGNDFAQGQMDARKALDILSESDLLENDDRVALELGGEACRLISFALRMRGLLTSADNWADSAISMLQQNGFRATALSEVYNIKALIAINFTQKTGLPAAYKLPRHLIRAVGSFGQFVENNIEAISSDLDRRIEVISRKADTIELIGTPGSVVEFLQNENYEQIARELPEHTLCLKLIYLARSYAKAGKLDESWHFIQEAAALPPAKESNFVQVALLETMATVFEESKEVDLAYKCRRDAKRLRALESIHEIGQG